MQLYGIRITWYMYTSFTYVCMYNRIQIRYEPSKIIVFVIRCSGVIARTNIRMNEFLLHICMYVHTYVHNIIIIL